MVEVLGTLLALFKAVGGLKSVLAVLTAIGAGVSYKKDVHGKLHRKVKGETVHHTKHHTHSDKR